MARHDDARTVRALPFATRWLEETH
eukprot:COSAG02_NODE_16986_length_1038_cov_0.965921_3_plen_24_part_01